MMETEVWVVPGTQASGAGGRKAVVEFEEGRGRSRTMEMEW